MSNHLSAAMTYNGIMATEYRRKDALVCIATEVGVKGWQLQSPEGLPLAPMRGSRHTAEQDAEYFMNKLEVIAEALEQIRGKSHDYDIDPDQINSRADKLLESR